MVAEAVQMSVEFLVGKMPPVFKPDREWGK
jgi:hypothetical protein